MKGELAYRAPLVVGSKKMVDIATVPVGDAGLVELVGGEGYVDGMGAFPAQVVATTRLEGFSLSRNIAKKMIKNSKTVQVRTQITPKVALPRPLLASRDPHCKTPACHVTRNLAPG